MNILSLKNWSQRQQVLAVIVMAGLVLFLLWFFLLMPLTRERRRLEKEIAGMRSQLASRNYLLGEDVLEKKRRDEERFNRLLMHEWAATVARVAAFPNPEDLPPEDVRHIDFKVALFDVRHRLQQKSRALRVSLPLNLGIEDTVSSSADARKLMLQLRTVEKLVDMGLDLKFGVMREIEPLAPVLHQLGKAPDDTLEEYPVNVEFHGTRENLYDLLRAIMEPEHVFVLKRLKVQAAQGQPGLLSIRAELSGLVFLKTPAEIEAALPQQPTGRVRSAPRGH